jgi:hypothetical protein
MISGIYDTRCEELLNGLTNSDGAETINDYSEKLAKHVLLLIEEEDIVTLDNFLDNVIGVSNPGSIIWCCKAYTQLEQGHYKSALEYTDHGLSKNASDSRLWCVRGLCLKSSSTQKVNELHKKLTSFAKCLHKKSNQFTFKNFKMHD